MIYLIIVALCIPIAIEWAAGIDTMMKEHPDYKGEDFLQ